MLPGNKLCHNSLVRDQKDLVQGEMSDAVSNHPYNKHAPWHEKRFGSKSSSTFLSGSADNSVSIAFESIRAVTANSK